MNKEQQQIAENNTILAIQILLNNLNSSIKIKFLIEEFQEEATNLDQYNAHKMSIGILVDVFDVEDKAEMVAKMEPHDKMTLLNGVVRGLDLEDQTMLMHFLSKGITEKTGEIVKKKLDRDIDDYHRCNPISNSPIYNGGDRIHINKNTKNN